MSGHSKWSQIKHQKATTDAKKGKAFSKLSRLITMAAKKGGDPQSNFELRYAVNEARAVNMPSDGIERAIKKGTGELQGERLEEVRYEAFGPGGVAILIEGITDNKNRTSNEIKHLLSLNEAKLATPGSALWAFEKSADGTSWLAKNPVDVQEKEAGQIKKITEELENMDDVQSVYTNAKP